MNSFLKFLNQNLINYGTFIVISLMIFSTLLSFYNKREMLQTTNDKNKAIEIKQKLNSLFAENLNGIDLGLRGYAITKNEQILNPYNDNFKKTKDNLNVIETLLTDQRLDSNVIQFKKIKSEFYNYLAFCETLKLAAKEEDISNFKELLKLDKGYDLYQLFSPFEKNLMKYEERIILKAEENYESAMNRNILTQFILLLFGIPILLTIIRRLNNESKGRKKLSLQLEKNNRQYLFDDGSVIESKDIKEVIEISINNFKKANEFISKISDGNHEANWNGMNEKNIILNQDNLAGRLSKMSEQMKLVKKEDEKRNWTNEGLTKFSEIVRNNQHDLKILSDQCILFLTKYLNAQQGSLFVVQLDRGNEKFLNLTGCYAFNKKKFLEKRIDIGSGLIGQAYLEAKTILLKQLPKGYTEITSGLGEATPDCILIAPFKYNDKVEAIIELAGFGNFESHQVNFIEKAGEFLASALLSVDNTQKMKELLEQSQEQGEMLRAQEEEMRQNMEELEATQEEMYRKNNEMEQTFFEMKKQTEEIIAKEKKLKESELWLQTIIDHLPKAVFWKEKNNLAYIGANKIFSEIAGFNSKSIVGKTDYDCPWKKEESDSFRKDDREVLTTKVSKIDMEEKQTNSDGETKWMSTTKVPILDDNNESVAILCMFEDITERKMREESFYEKIKEIEILKDENKKLKQKLQLA